jgi:hypothetical protein
VLSSPVDCNKLGTLCAPPPQDFSPVKIIPHESYNAPNPFQNDVALIQLDKPIVRNGNSFEILSMYS